MDQSIGLIAELESAGVLADIASHQHYRESNLEPLFKKLRPFFADDFACQYCVEETSEGSALTVLFTGSEGAMQFGFFHAPRVAAPFFVCPGEGLFYSGRTIRPNEADHTLVGCSTNLPLASVPSGVQLSSCSPFLGRVLVLLGSFAAFKEEKLPGETMAFLTAAMSESGRVIFLLDDGVGLYGSAKACTYLNPVVQ